MCNTFKPSGGFRRYGRGYALVVTSRRHTAAIYGRHNELRSPEPQIKLRDWISPVTSRIVIGTDSTIHRWR
jgi:hypothetical protein